MTANNVIGARIFERTDPIARSNISRARLHRGNNRLTNNAGHGPNLNHSSQLRSITPPPSSRGSDDENQLPSFRLPTSPFPVRSRGSLPPLPATRFICDNHRESLLRGIYFANYAVRKGEREEPHVPAPSLSLLVSLVLRNAVRRAVAQDK